MPYIYTMVIAKTSRKVLGLERAQAEVVHEHEPFV